LLTTTVIDVKAGTDDKGLISLYTLKGSLVHCQDKIFC
jgi:hypothetical protein